MAIEAPYSKHKRNNIKIAIAVCIGLAVWCAYDGYFNQKWIEEHTDANGKPETYLVFNRKAPPYLAAAAVLLCVYLFTTKGKKVVAGENELIIGSKQRIPYNSIQKIDKTGFDSKGCFIITYKSKDGGEVDFKITDRTYDNLAAILEHLVAKIS